MSADERVAESNRAAPQPVPSGDVPALRKGLAVLELLAAGDALTMIEIQRRAQIGKTMTFRILRVLRELGYVQHEADSRRYSGTVKLLELGTAFAARLDIVRVSQPLLEDLRAAFLETANLCVRDGCDVVYVASVERQHGLRASTLVGSRDSLHSTAVGKVILAFLPDAEREEVIAHCSLPQFTPSTFSTPQALRAELARTLQRGYAVDNEENELGARCVAVPILGVRGYPIAGLSLSGPVNRIGEEKMTKMVRGLWQASRDVSQQLGYVVGTDYLAAF
jgi:IclR family acetate operon transcriptional repressor